MIPRLRPQLGIKELLTAYLPSRGNEVERFEKEFATMTDQRHAVAFPYGRTGMYCLFKALGLQGQEIITPAWTCVVVPHAIVKSGNEPVFVDSRMQDYNMDLEIAEREINDRTGAIVATSIFGHPVDLDQLDSLRTSNPHIPVIQDCAHSFLCSWQGRMVHKEGIAAVFGLNVSKLMTSIFGGMITTDDDNLADRLRQIRAREIKAAPWQKSIKRRIYLLAATASLSPRVYGIVNKLERLGVLNRFVKYYDDSIIDFPEDWDINITAPEARVGIVQCKRYPNIIANRKRNAALYHELLKNVPNITLPPQEKGATYSHFTILVNERERFIKQALQHGIQLGELIEYSIPEMRAYKNRSGYRDCPVARYLSKHSVNIPVWCNKKVLKISRP